MPFASPAQNEIIARRTPRGLFCDFDVGHTVLGENSFFLRDKQRRRIGERDKAEGRLRYLGSIS